MKKYYFLLAIAVVTSTSTLLSQTGPGGVGSLSNLETWLDATNIVAADNDPISTWTDQSGNANNANQGTSTFQPIFKTNQVNGLPSVRFDGLNDRLDFLSNVSATEISFFAVYKSNSTSIRALITLDRHLFYGVKGSPRAVYGTFGSALTLRSKTNPDYTVISNHTNSNTTSGTLLMTGDDYDVTFSRGSMFNFPTSTIGSRAVSGRPRETFFDGDISEIVIFNQELNSASRKIVGNYLAAKYNLITEQNLYSFKSTHGFEVFGIGQESDGSNSTAQGTGLIEVSNASALGNGDYLLIGHDNGGLTTTSAVGGAFATNRYTQIWRAGVTNTPGTVDLKFFLAGNNFAVDPNSDYRLLIDNTTGAFDNSSISQSLSGTYNSLDQTITFTGVSLSGGNYFTLADRPNEITAVNTGSWNTPGTWSCNCIPTSTDNALIPATKTVNVNGATAKINGLTIDAGGTLNFSTNDSLLLKGDLLNNGSITSTTGLLGFTGTSAQEAWNNSGSAVTLFDFYANNAANVSLKSGDWNITNFIKVSSGQLVNDGATVTLVSDAGTQAQIQPSATNSFSGEFILQRYFSARNANYADITAPVISTTIADWDNELFMSGVGGNDGDATDGPGGTIYRSVTKYNNTTKAYIYVTSIAETIVAGEGIELFLGDNLTTFAAQTMDHRGTPYTGPKAIILKPGFNFIANPYSCFINYSLVSKSGLNNQFYVYEQNSGAYNLYNGGFIAAHQGFWVNNTFGTDKTLTFNESNKLPLAFSQILKLRDEKKFALTVKSLGNGFGNDLTVTPSVTADNGLDLEDEYYLASPHKATTALTTQPTASDVKLIGTAINSMDENQSIPVAFKAGEDGSYTIEAKDVSELLAIYGCVLLEDKVEGKIIDLNSSSTYTFSSTIGEYNRFNLHLFKSAEDCKDLLAKADQHQTTTSGISIVKKGDIVQLDFNVAEGSQAQIDIYNLNGQKVAATQFIGIEGAGSQQLENTAALKGIHLIVVRTNNEVITEKFNF